MSKVKRKLRGRLIPLMEILVGRSCVPTNGWVHEVDTTAFEILHNRDAKLRIIRNLDQIAIQTSTMRSILLEPAKNDLADLDCEIQPYK